MEYEKISTVSSLVVWQVAHQFVLETYKQTEKFSRQEVFGLILQLRRAVVSVVNNLVEGHGRK
ncbi:TPA: four helix bundle protein [Candidatus Uhrbacteria bacterium]|nr:four helix bundle protein [Candidatus Uhrbacteria bacterium]HCU31300.1 four helix bundle protein [Candidatus Uhrbacteria bacterium]